MMRKSWSVCLCVCVKQRDPCYRRTREGVCCHVSTHSQWPVACNWAPAVSLSVFLLITHHSSCGKAPHKLQHIVSRRSACHHTAPCFRTRLIVHEEESRGSGEGLSVTNTLNRAHKTSVCPRSHTHAHTQAWPISSGASWLCDPDAFLSCRRENGSDGSNTPLWHTNTQRSWTECHGGELNCVSFVDQVNDGSAPGDEKRRSAPLVSTVRLKQKQQKRHCSLKRSLQVD